MTTYWIDPATPTGSDAEIEPLPPRARVCLDSDLNDHGFKSWRAKFADGSNHLYDTLEEAHDMAHLSPVIGKRVAVVAGIHDGLSGTVTAVRRGLFGQHVIEVELDRYGVNAYFFADELEVLP
ncbi:hypothetical protein AB0284_21540 [Pseudarthrobacter phenanthrenivorans]|uniref:hypothetical protein n=1 Tax=Pseudarthrobacter phenanthrenivorans TaxID=361575 RepID=UPI00344C7FE9